MDVFNPSLGSSKLVEQENRQIKQTLAELCVPGSPSSAKKLGN
jgi:hypothetical protein